jgi:hypothetical protein
MKVKPGGPGREARRIFMVALSILLMAAGLLISPLPVPLPIGFGTFLFGCAILVTYSKSSRRFVQYLRHRNDWLSRTLDYASRRAPQKARAVLYRTRPNALRRHARLRDRRKS